MAAVYIHRYSKNKFKSFALGFFLIASGYCWYSFLTISFFWEEIRGSQHMLKDSRFMCSSGLGDMVLWNVGLHNTTCDVDLLKVPTEFNA